MTTATQEKNPDVESIRRVVQATVAYCSRETKTNERFLRIAVRDALRRLLVRKPTNEEVERAMS